MPSPFPGMDPYLEAPALWRGLHGFLITQAAAALNAVLPPRFVANVDERVYLERFERDAYPDVAVLERPARGPIGPRSTTATATATATAKRTARADPSLVVRYQVAEFRERFVEIVATGDGGRVVAVIEFLSHANKRPGAGRRKYLAKQRRLLESSTHLIEVDLLRAGPHTAAIPEELLAAARPSWHYLACLHRADVPGQFELWPATVRDPLPRIAVPLADDQPDAVLDLQSLLRISYDAAAYDRRIDYAADPVPPLPSADAEWADALLKARGLRPSPTADDGGAA